MLSLEFTHYKKIFIWRALQSKSVVSLIFVKLDMRLFSIKVYLISETTTKTQRLIYGLWGKNRNCYKPINSIFK